MNQPRESHILYIFRQPQAHPDSKAEHLGGKNVKEFSGYVF
jgi:hypothetical protein